MFRDLTRKKQKLSLEECKEILKQEVRGVLAVNGDDGYPTLCLSIFTLTRETIKSIFTAERSGISSMRLIAAIRFLSAFMIRAITRTDIGRSISKA